MFIVLGIYNFSATAANVSGRREMGVGLNCSKKTNYFSSNYEKQNLINFGLNLISYMHIMAFLQNI